MTHKAALEREIVGKGRGVQADYRSTEEPTYNDRRLLCGQETGTTFCRALLKIEEFKLSAKPAYLQILQSYNELLIRGQ